MAAGLVEQIAVRLLVVAIVTSVFQLEFIEVCSVAGQAVLGMHRNLMDGNVRCLTMALCTERIPFWRFAVRLVADCATYALAGGMPGFLMFGVAFQAKLLSRWCYLFMRAVAARADYPVAAWFVMEGEDHAARAAVCMAFNAKALGQLRRIARSFLRFNGEMVAGQAMLGPNRIGNGLVWMALRADLMRACNRHGLRRQVALPADRSASEVQFMHMIAFDGADFSRYKRCCVFRMDRHATEHCPIHLRRTILTACVQVDSETDYCD